jgi:hypothetical protein
MKGKYFKYIDERQLALDCAVEEAVEVATAEATATALAIGHKKGVTKVAKAMLVDGLDPAFIARYTKLPVKQIKAIRSA